MITLTKEQFITFNLGKKTAQKLTNDFVFTFVDASKDYTTRTVSAKNSASIQESLTTRQQSFDFTAFNNTDTVYKQGYKALKKYSFPISALSFEVSRTIGNTINISDLVTIQNNDYGINGEFRIDKKTDSKINQNLMSFEAEQYTSNLFDNNYVNSGGGGWIPPVNTLNPFIKYRIIELPYTNKYGYNTAYLILVQRELGIETGFNVYISTNGTDYSYLNTLHSFAQHGLLSSAYGLTDDLDKSLTGIKYTPDKTDLTFNSISDQNLFLVTRVAIVDSEIIAFANYNPSGVSDIVLTDIIRGVQYSNIASHLNGSDIWVTNIAVENTMEISRTDTFYLKLVPVSGEVEGDLAQATAIQITPSFTAKKPYKPVRIEATRTGSNIHVKVYPILKEHVGVGKASYNSVEDVYPFSFDGQISYSIDNINWTNNGNSSEFDIVNSNIITIYAKQVLYNYNSSEISILVGTTDGLYVGR